MLKESEFIGFGQNYNKDEFYYNNCIIDCSANKCICDEVLKKQSQIVDKKIYHDYSLLREFYESNANKIGINWIEYFHEDNEINSRNNEVVLISLEKIKNNRRVSYPVGFLKKDIYDSKRLIDNIEYINSIQTSSALSSDKVVVLSPYSTGVIIHEVIGHIAEIENSNHDIEIINGIINDVPVSLMDYNLDDYGRPGTKVNICKNKLTNQSGNGFCEVSVQRQVHSLIRQRNLEFIPLNKTECMDNHRLPIFLAGINSARMCLNIIAELDGEFQKLNVPIKDIVSIRALSNELIELIEICHKNSCPHYFGVKTPWSEMMLSKNLGEYIVCN